MGGIGGDVVLAFLHEQRSHQQRYLGTKLADKVVTYVASTAAAGSVAAVSVHRLRSLRRGASPAELLVGLGGMLPRPPGPGESVAVCLINRYVGYQVKTPGGDGLVEADGADLLIRGAQVFTLHHSPFIATAFDRVPFEEILGATGRTAFALVGVGAQVNLSPRFSWHAELRDGRLVLFHGDVLPLKTARNLEANRRVVRALLDPVTFQGFLLEGQVEECTARDEPAACAATIDGLAAASSGRPARLFRFTADAIHPLAPDAQPRTTASPSV